MIVYFSRAIFSTDAFKMRISLGKRDFIMMGFIKGQLMTKQKYLGYYISLKLHKLTKSDVYKTRI